jgi:hypothetical protein
VTIPAARSELAVGCVLQLAGGNEALRAEAGAQQAQRMATEGEAGAGVVGNQVLGLGWLASWQASSGRLVDAAQQIELYGNPGGRPGGLPTMAGQLGQRAGSGEQIEIPVRSAARVARSATLAKAAAGELRAGATQRPAAGR